MSTAECCSTCAVHGACPTLGHSISKTHVFETPVSRKRIENTPSPLFETLPNFERDVRHGESGNIPRNSPPCVELVRAARHSLRCKVFERLSLSLPSSPFCSRTWHIAAPPAAQSRPAQPNLPDARFRAAARLDARCVLSPRCHWLKRTRGHRRLFQLARIPWATLPPTRHPPRQTLCVPVLPTNTARERL